MNARDSLRMPMQSDVASGSVRRLEDGLLRKPLAFGAEA